MWFSTRRSELSYVDASPRRIANVVDIAAPPERLFHLFATGERQTEWFEDFVACRWTSPEPHGVGSEREIELALVSVKERFLVWEPGARLTFSIDAITMPIVSQMVEDLRFVPTSEGKGTQLIWHVHYTPSAMMIPVHEFARLMFARMFRRSAEGVKRFAEMNP